MKLKIILGLFLALFLCAAISPQAQAQVNDGRFVSFSLDTFTNADTIVLSFDKNVWDLDKYDRTFQLAFTKISGTTSATCLVQETMYSAGTNWITTDTISFGNASSTVFDTADVTGVRLRLYCTSTGSMSASIKGILRVRRKKF